MAQHAKRRNAPSSAESQRGVGEWRTEHNASPSEFRALSDAASRPVALSPARQSSPTEDRGTLGDGGVGEVLNFSQTTPGGYADHAAGKRPLSRPTPTHPPSAAVHLGHAGGDSERASRSATPGAQGGTSGRATVQSIRSTVTPTTPHHASSLRPSGGDRSGSSSSAHSSSGSETEGHHTHRSSRQAQHDAGGRPTDQHGHHTPIASSRRDAKPTTATATTAVAVVPNQTSSNAFQKQGLRHTRQNWRAMHTTNNAMCLPKPDPSVHAVLSRMLGRRLLVPLPEQQQMPSKKIQADSGGPTHHTTPPVTVAPTDQERRPPRTSATPGGASSSTPLADSSRPGGGNTVEAPPGHRNTVSGGDHDDSHHLSRGKSTDNRSLVTTPNVFFSRSETPTGSSAVQTSIIPSHAHPPEPARPPSQLALSELLLASPPSTASQLLSRNLLGLTIGDSEGSNSMSLLGTNAHVAPDRRLAAAVGTYHHHANTSGSGGAGAGGFSASASVIGSLRPNSVMRLPPIVSTSMADGRRPPGNGMEHTGPTGGGSCGGDPVGRPPRGGVPTQQHRTVEWTAKHRQGHGSHSTHDANVSAEGDASLPPYVGDPEEVLLGGGGMFAVLTPGQSALPTASFQTLDAPVGVSPLVVQGVHHQSVPIKDKSSHRPQQGPAASGGSLTHNALTPQRLLTFGLSGPSQDDGGPLELDTVVREHPTTGRECGGSNLGKLRLPQHHLLAHQRVSPDGAQSPSLSGSVVASSLKQKQASGRHRHTSDDPSQRVAEVCAWGYDLRSLFLVQLARDALTLPRFLATHGTSSYGTVAAPLPPLETWVLWLQLGGSKEADAAETLKRRPGLHANKNIASEKQIRDMERVIATASAYVGSTFLRGRNAAAAITNTSRSSIAPRGNRGSLHHTMVPSPSPQPGVASSSLDRTEVRKLLVDQGLQIADVCHMFKDAALGGMSTSEAQRIVKEWLLDPAFHHPKVEACMAQLVGEAGTLRDLLMDCLRWNREEREAFEYFALVTGDAAHALASTDNDLQSPSDDTAEASTATLQRLWRLREDDIQFLAHMEAVLDAYNRRWRDVVSGGSSRSGSNHNNSGSAVATTLQPMQPETVEAFCAAQYLSLADVCAWLARSHTFDRSIMRHIWTFVVAHQADRRRRMRPLTKLQALQRALHAAASSDGGALVDGGGANVDSDRQRAMADIQAESKSKVVTNPRTELRSTRRIPQDQFVLETVIGKLRLQDAEDRHNAVLHGGVAASLLLQTKAYPAGSGPDDQARTRVGWRALARHQAAHQEMLFRQDAELLRHVVKRRAEPHHRTNLQRVQAMWRASRNEDPMEDMPHRPGAVAIASGAPPTAVHSAMVVVGSGNADDAWTELGGAPDDAYRPVCQGTLESFLSIQSLATERLPPRLVSYLKECLSE